MPPAIDEWEAESKGGGQGGKPEETVVRNYCLRADGKSTEETHACEPVEMTV